MLVESSMVSLWQCLSQAPVVHFNTDLLSLNLPQCYCTGDTFLNAWVNEVLMSLWIPLVVFMISRLFIITTQLLPHSSIIYCSCYSLKCCDTTYFLYFVITLLFMWIVFSTRLKNMMPILNWQQLWNDLYLKNTRTSGLDYLNMAHRQIWLMAASQG